MSGAMLQGVKDWLAEHVGRDGWIWYFMRAAYNPRRTLKHVYRRITGDGIFFEERELPMCSLQMPKTIDRVIGLYDPRSIIDLGCGVGLSLDAFLARGIDAVGVEGSALAIAKARHPDCIRRHNLNAALDLGRRFDLIWSIEVVEHIHPRYVEQLTRTFSNHSDRIVMSAAHPGQGGEGHFNEQWPEYWIAQFAKNGYTLDDAGTEALRAIDEQHSQNILVFERDSR